MIPRRSYNLVLQAKIVRRRRRDLQPGQDILIPKRPYFSEIAEQCHSQAKRYELKIGIIPDLMKIVRHSHDDATMMQICGNYNAIVRQKGHLGAALRARLYLRFAPTKPRSGSCPIRVTILARPCAWLRHARSREAASGHVFEGGRW